jgi:hypothetical protein
VAAMHAHAEQQQGRVELKTSAASDLRRRCRHCGASNNLLRRVLQRPVCAGRVR